MRIRRFTQGSQGSSFENVSACSPYCPPHRLALPRRPLELSLAPASCCSLELPSPFRQACSFCRSPGSPRWWGTVRRKGKGNREKSVLVLVLSAHFSPPLRSDGSPRRPDGASKISKGVEALGSCRSTSKHQGPEAGSGTVCTWKQT
jgi:hypothetical protein